MELTVPQMVAAPMFDIQWKKWILFTLTFNKYIIFLVKTPISILLQQVMNKQEHNHICNQMW